MGEREYNMYKRNYGRSYNKSNYKPTKRTKRVNPLYKATVSDVASAALDGVKAIRKLINVETQILETSFSTVFAANTAQIFHLTNIPQGDGQGNRMGNSVLMSYIKCNEYMVATSTTVVRQILFQDMQQVSDTIPSAGDILENGSDTMAFINKSTIGRFKIISDELFVLESGNSGLSRANRLHNSFNHHARFNGSAGSDIQKGGVYRLILPDKIVNHISQYRVGFHDN